MSILNKVSSINADKPTSFILSAQAAAAPGCYMIQLLTIMRLFIIKHSFQDQEGGGISIDLGI